MMGEFQQRHTSAVPGVAHALSPRSDRECLSVGVGPIGCAAPQNGRTSSVRLELVAEIPEGEEQANKKEAMTVDAQDAVLADEQPSKVLLPGEVRSTFGPLEYFGGRFRHHAPALTHTECLPCTPDSKATAIPAPLACASVRERNTRSTPTAVLCTACSELSRFRLLLQSASLEVDRYL
jgi:hypothetical protein